ncbi:MAG: phosphopantothenoylcysteine decarboxylase [Candidatus Omnitrophota bacterium]
MRQVQKKSTDKAKKKKLKSLGRITVTAGPTIEPIDPIRYITNHSTGRMGYEIARAALNAGFQVTLISGPVNLKSPQKADLVKVQTACEMRSKVIENAKKSECLIMTAAVSDFRVQSPSSEKIKKKDKLTLKLLKNPDILKQVADMKDLIRIGFALETKEPLKYAFRKLRDKKLDFIVVNSKSGSVDPFGPGKKEYTIITKTGEISAYKGISKRQIAELIIFKVTKEHENRKK